jgi:hypothetical protein
MSDGPQRQPIPYNFEVENDLIVGNNLTVDGQTVQADDIILTDVDVQDTGGTTQFRLDGDTGTPFFDLVGNRTENEGRVTVNRADVSTSVSTSSFPSARFFSVDSSGGTRTVTLSSSDANDGEQIDVKRNGGNTVTIDTEGSETIDDNASISLSSDDEAVSLIYNSGNTDWEIW